MKISTKKRKNEKIALGCIMLSITVMKFCCFELFERKDFVAKFHPSLARCQGQVLGLGLGVRFRC